MTESKHVSHLEIDNRVCNVEQRVLSKSQSVKSHRSSFVKLQSGETFWNRGHFSTSKRIAAGLEDETRVQS